MPEGTYEKGLAGESRAADYLQMRGMVLLQRRYRSPFGEIDLILRDGDTLVMAEVKARGRGREGSGLLSVGPVKRGKIIRTARLYLAEHPWDGPVRFDVVEFTADGIRHIADAFPGSEY
ncbi:MAG: YraN family protein [Clostridiales bacterium]|nr:YraN family protein [Clostridiales bacterium]